MINYNYLLDSYTLSQLAFSMFKLRSSYSGACLRVRRSSDNSEQDINFVNNYLDTASLLSFVGANNGFVVTWYDQSGNTRNLSRATAVNQPQIVSSGALITRNGIAVMSCSSTQSLTLVTGILNTTSHAWWLTFEKDTTGNQAIVARDATNVLYLDYGTSQYVGNVDFVTIGSALSVNNFRVVNSIYQFPSTSTTFTFYANGSQLGTKNSTATIGSVRSGIQTLPYSSSRTAKIFMNEFVMWQVDQNTNRINIENNINSRNLIY